MSVALQYLQYDALNNISDDSCHPFGKLFVSITFDFWYIIHIVALIMRCIQNTNHTPKPPVVGLGHAWADRWITDIHAVLIDGVTIWPSGLRRWSKANPVKQASTLPVRKGVGSNPTVVTVF